MARSGLRMMPTFPLPSLKFRTAGFSQYGFKAGIWLEFLPAYAAELNPTEYIWGHLKQHEIANLCPKSLSELSLEAVRALKRMRRRPTLVLAFWRQAELFPV